MEFSRLIDEFLNHQTAAEIDTPDGWTQGRTAYGGLTGALMLAAVQSAHDDLPPLRTIQINFAGPASGRIKVSTDILRRGKNTVTIEARLTGDDALAGRAIFTFGVNRDMQVQAHYTRRDDIPQPEEIPDLTWNDRVPVFMKHFEARAIKLSVPMSGSAEDDNLIWFRHKDANDRDGIVPLIALGDAPPPAVLGMMKSVRGISLDELEYQYAGRHPKRAMAGGCSTRFHNMPAMAMLTNHACLGRRRHPHHGRHANDCGF